MFTKISFLHTLLIAEEATLFTKKNFEEIKKNQDYKTPKMKT